MGKGIPKKFLRRDGTMIKDPVKADDGNTYDRDDLDDLIKSDGGREIYCKGEHQDVGDLPTDEVLKVELEEYKKSIEAEGQASSAQGQVLSIDQTEPGASESPQPAVETKAVSIKTPMVVTSVAEDSHVVPSQPISAMSAATFGSVTAHQDQASSSSVASVSSYAAVRESAIEERSSETSSVRTSASSQSYLNVASSSSYPPADSNSVISCYSTTILASGQANLSSSNHEVKDSKEVKQDSKEEEKIVSHLVRLIQEQYRAMGEKPIELTIEESANFLLKDSFINLAIVYEQEQKDREEQELKLKGDRNHSERKESKEENKSNWDNIQCSSVENISQRGELNKKKADFGDIQRSSIENIYQPKEKIDLAAIFDLDRKQKEEKKPQTLLIEGRAGIGKTTLAHYLAYQWSVRNTAPCVIKKWAKDFGCIVLIPLRRLLTIESSKPMPKDLEGAVVEFLFFNVLDDERREQITQDEFTNEFKKLEKGNAKILYVLDGYDEVVSIKEEKNERGSILRVLLSKSNHILMSRSNVVDVQQKFDRRLENIGFTKENIQIYIQNFFAKIVTDGSAQKHNMTLARFLKSNSGITGIVHIPLILELLCNLWKNRAQEYKDTEEFTITDLYQDMIFYMQKRFLQRESQKTGISKESCREDIQAHTMSQALCIVLEQIAWKAMKNNALIIDANTVKEIILEQEKKEEFLKIFIDPESKVTHLFQAQAKDQWRKMLLKDFGFLKAIGDFKKSPLECDYYFNHLTFQEFFAAQYLVRGFLSDTNSQAYQEAYDFIRYNKYDRWFAMVLMFVAGLLSLYQTKNTGQGISSFWKAIEAMPRDLVGFGHMQLVVRCLNEAKCDKRVPGKDKMLTEVLRFARQQIISTEKNIIPLGLDKIFVGNPVVFFKSDVLGLLIEALNDKTENVICSARGLLENLELDEKEGKILVNSLGGKLRDNNWHIRKLIIELLNILNLSEEARLELIKFLVVALRDKNQKVWVVDAFDELRFNEKEQDALANYLVEALKDKDSGIRESAAEGLSKLWLSEKSSEALVAPLTQALRDENPKVRFFVIEVLGGLKLNEKMSEVLVNPLVIALMDQDKDVRLSVLGALDGIKINEKAREALTNFLIGVLNDENSQIRYLAAAALSKLKLSEKINEALVNPLVEALMDEDVDVRFFAIIAFGKLNLSEEVRVAVVNFLVVMLRSESAYVRSSAVKALGRLTLNEKLSEVLVNPLTEALMDENNEVRSSTADAVCALQLDKKVSEFLVNYLFLVLEDKKKQRIGYLAIAACNKFEFMEKTHTMFICLLLNALRDDDITVRRLAVKAFSELKISGKESEILIDSLVEALSDIDVVVRISAIKALCNLKLNEKASEVLVDFLAEALQDAHANIRLVTVKALNKLNLSEKANGILVNSLAKALDDQYHVVRLLAAEALSKLKINEKVSEALIYTLVCTLRDKDQEVRKRVFEALSRLNFSEKTNKASVSSLGNTLLDPDAGVRSSALELLNKIFSQHFITKLFEEFVEVLPVFLFQWLLQRGTVLAYNYTQEIIFYDSSCKPFEYSFLARAIDTRHQQLSDSLDVQTHYYQEQILMVVLIKAMRAQAEECGLPTDVHDRYLSLIKNQKMHWSMIATAIAFYRANRENGLKSSIVNLCQYKIKPELDKFIQGDDNLVEVKRL